MFWTKRKASTRKVILSLAVLCLTAAGLIFGAQFNSTDASTSVSANSSAASPSATFPANAASLGAIPDGATTCDGTAAPRDVTFTVTGVSGTISNVAVSLTFGPAHTWVGDLDVRLIAPGGAPVHVIFSRTGSTTPTGFGDSSDATGPYNFLDTAPAAPTWWAAAAGTAGPVPPGSYRTSTAGGVVGGGANTLMTPVFASLGAAANGTWILRVADHCSGDTGSVSAATLTIDTAGGGGGDAPVDFNADGRTDYVVVRNLGVANVPPNQARWFYNINPSGPTEARDWGLANTDFFISEDFDNDNKDDIAVWRPGAATVAAFYILNSATLTARVERFGQTGDDPTVVDDYNNDGSADLAIYRDGVGVPSYWIYRTVANGPLTYIQWGQNGDFPVPGDIDGNGSADFTVQRNGGGNVGHFWTRLSTGATSVTVFGLASDLVVPGDYDGDGKTDLAVARYGVAGTQIQWYIRRSLDGVVVGPIFWGNSSTDFVAHGDYDGDGKIDPAIWRSGTFWSFNSATSTAVPFSLGAAGDYPVANFNSH